MYPFCYRSVEVFNYSSEIIFLLAFISVLPHVFDALLLGTYTVRIVMSSWRTDTVITTSRPSVSLVTFLALSLCCLKLIQLSALSFDQWQHAIFSVFEQNFMCIPDLIHMQIPTYLILCLLRN